MKLTRRSILAITAAVALAMSGCATTSGPEAEKETAGQYMDDATVTARVKTAIAADVGIKAASNVNVETYRGVVQLSGFADSEDQAARAVTSAKKIKGVRSVRNDLRVK